MTSSNRLAIQADDLPAAAEEWGLPYVKVLQAYCFARLLREMVTPKGPLAMLAWAPFERHMGQQGEHLAHDNVAFGQAIGAGRHVVIYARRRRWVTVVQAERWCEAAGVLPCEVWGDWYYAVCAVLYPPQKTRRRNGAVVAA